MLSRLIAVGVAEGLEARLLHAQAQLTEQLVLLQAAGIAECGIVEDACLDLLQQPYSHLGAIAELHVRGGALLIGQI
ncbi:hypothetical protein D3C80_2014810 [compost metagenome]